MDVWLYFVTLSTYCTCITAITSYRNDCRGGGGGKFEAQPVTAELGYVRSVSSVTGTGTGTIQAVGASVLSLSAGIGLGVGERYAPASTTMSAAAPAAAVAVPPSPAPAPVLAVAAGSAGPGGTGTSDASTLLPCPLEFRLHRGQRINFTLFDFSLRNLTTGEGDGRRNAGGQTGTGGAAPSRGHQGGDERTKLCSRIFVIDEPAVGNSITVCEGRVGGVASWRGGWDGLGAWRGAGGGAGDWQRESLVYTSRSNLVRVQLMPASPARYILKFEGQSVNSRDKLICVDM